MFIELNNLQAYHILTFALLGTYRLIKRKLQEEGFNPLTVADPLYFMDKKAAKYVKLNRETYDKIINGEILL